MSNKKIHIYLLPLYANKENLEENRYKTEHESRIQFSKNNLKLELSEVNSLIEERYCLSIMSARYILEGTMSKNEIKEAMIHHHPYGHPWKHLQFKLNSQDEVIRINIEPIDEEDYLKCIKGFLYISQDLIKFEQKENNIDQNIIHHFFDKKINELEDFRIYLLNKIKTAYNNGNILNNFNESINSEKLEILKSERRLLPFLDFN